MRWVDRSRRCRADWSVDEPLANRSDPQSAPAVAVNAPGVAPSPLAVPPQVVAERLGETARPRSYFSGVVLVSLLSGWDGALRDSPVLALPSSPTGPAPRGSCCSLPAFCCVVLGRSPVSGLRSGAFTSLDWLWPRVPSSPTGPPPRRAWCRLPALFFVWLPGLLVLAELETPGSFVSFSVVFVSSPRAVAPSARIAAAPSVETRLNFMLASFNHASYCPQEHD